MATAKSNKKSPTLKKPGATATISQLKAYLKSASALKRKKEKLAREEKKRKELLKKVRQTKI